MARVARAGQGWPRVARCGQGWLGVSRAYQDWPGPAGALLVHWWQDGRLLLIIDNTPPIILACTQLVPIVSGVLV